MIFHTFGNENNRVMVLIHGMLTPWQIWEDVAGFFGKNYYVIVPELDGHTEDEVSEFICIEDEAEQIRNYLIERFDGKVSALAGLSMGGRIASVLAGMPGMHVDRMILDGAPLSKMPGFLISMMKRNYIKIIRKSKKRDPRTIENCKKVFLPERYLDDFLKVADHMEEQSVRNIMESVFSRFEYRMYDESMKILFMHGTKENELVAARSAAKMKQANPQTEIKKFDGYAHAELACFKPQKWIEEVSAWLEKTERGDRIL